MSSIAGPHAARLFAPIQGECVGAKLFAPISVFEALLELFRLGDQTSGAPKIAESSGAIGGCEPSRIDITLHLDQSDGALGKVAIGVKDRVVGVFPPLILKPRIGLACIFHKSVAVD